MILLTVVYLSSLRNEVRFAPLVALIPWALYPLLSARAVLSWPIHCPLWPWRFQGSEPIDAIIYPFGAGAAYLLLAGIIYLLGLFVRAAAAWFGASGLELLELLGLRALHMVWLAVLLASWALLIRSTFQSLTLPSPDAYQDRLLLNESQEQRDDPREQPSEWGRDTLAMKASMVVRGPIPDLHGDVGESSNPCVLVVNWGNVETKLELPASPRFMEGSGGAIVSPVDKANCEPTRYWVDREHSLVFARVGRTLIRDLAWHVPRNGDAFPLPSTRIGGFTAYLSPPLGWIVGGFAGLGGAFALLGAVRRARVLRTKLLSGIEATYDGAGMFVLAGARRVRASIVPDIPIGTPCTLCDMHSDVLVHVYRSSAVPVVAVTPIVGCRNHLLANTEMRERATILFSLAILVSMSAPLVGWWLP
ncbi:hypothetical protein [Pendulispora albinea]|uniref:Uncharacterized protein n=1 Tax=Pendulispora albinea TaxID=2741071 RepID=A0ABZ2MC25_9BACT